MDLSLTPEQVGLSETLQRLLADLYPAAVLSTDEEPRAADRLWAELTGSGWLGVGVPEELGGSGGGAIELAIIFRHLGRAVAPSRYRSAVLARLLVRALARDDQLSEILPVLSAGQQTATVAYAEDGAENDPDHMATVAKHDGAGWRRFSDRCGPGAVRRRPRLLPREPGRTWAEHNGPADILPGSVLGRRPQRCAG